MSIYSSVGKFYSNLCECGKFGEMISANAATSHTSRYLIDTDEAGFLSEVFATFDNSHTSCKSDCGGQKKTRETIEHTTRNLLADIAGTLLCDSVNSSPENIIFSKIQETTINLSGTWNSSSIETSCRLTSIDLIEGAQVTTITQRAKRRPAGNTSG